jgi:DNA-binding transcriptional regulator YhcF (GntR family)
VLWLITQVINHSTKGGELVLDNLGEDKSIYLQISEMIEDEILRDIINEEEQVPSTTELSKFYKINPATAAKGINILVDEGILYKKRGIGMFVQAGAKEKVMESRKKKFKETYLKKIISEAKLIGLSKSDLKRLIDETTD